MIGLILLGFVVIIFIVLWLVEDLHKRVDRLEKNK